MVSTIDSPVALPVIESCESCAACCMDQGSPPGYILLHRHGGQGWPDQEDVERFRHLPSKARVILKKHIDRLRSKDPPRGDEPCCWLDMAARKCRFYEHRPQICRDFEMGSVACRTWREDQ